MGPEIGCKQGKERGGEGRLLLSCTFAALFISGQFPFFALHYEGEWSCRCSLIHSFCFAFLTCTLTSGRLTFMASSSLEKGQNKWCYNLGQTILYVELFYLEYTSG